MTRQFRFCEIELHNNDVAELKPVDASRVVGFPMIEAIVERRRHKNANRNSREWQEH